MQIEMNEKELEKYCDVIYDIISKDTIVNTNGSNKVICDYYKKSSFFYRNFHSKEGAMHLPIKLSDKESNKEKLLHQAESIHAIINNYDYLNILELGCGMGFNTNYLATKNPEKRFTGIDLEPTNLKFAQRKSKKVNRALFYQMDYDEMKEPSAKYDLIFAIETLCHSKNLIGLLDNLSNYLSDKGRIIIFDGYIKSGEASLTKEFEKHAYNLLSWGFALDGFQKIDTILEPNILNGLEIINVEDLSENVISYLLTFQRASIKTLKYPFFLKMLLRTRIIPLAFIKQISAGLLLPYFLKSGYLGYYKLEFQKSTLSNKGFASVGGQCE